MQYVTNRLFWTILPYLQLRCSWGQDEVITFRGQKVKSQDHTRHALFWRRHSDWQSAVDCHLVSNITASQVCCNHILLFEQLALNGFWIMNCKTFSSHIVPVHPWKSSKVLAFFLLYARPWKYLKTGQVLESPWISFHRSLKVHEFTMSDCTISATLLNRYFAGKTRFAKNCHFLSLKLSLNHRNRY